jgi:hypothetical protein
MRKIYLPLSLAGLATLAACGSDPIVTPAPAPVIIQPAPVVTAPPPTVVVQQPQVATVTPVAIRAGNGRIESVNSLPPSAATGASTPPMRRFGIKMDDGTVQYVDAAADHLNNGDRVELTTDGRIRRL